MTDTAIQTTNPKIDGRTKNGKKLDLLQVIKLKHVHNLSLAEISKQLGFSQPYVTKVYRNFQKIMPSFAETDAYQHNRSALLSGMEYKLLQNIAKPDKLKKGSVNNLAYAFDKVHTARRLEEGKSTAGGVTVSIEIAYQAATDQAKQARLRHAGAADISNNKDDN